MDNTICLIQIPLHQASLGNSFMAPLAERRFAGHTLLEWMVRRVMDVQRADQIVVVVSRQDAVLCDVQQLPPDVSLLIVDENDRLKQVCCALKKYPARGVIRISVDNPFVDPVLIDRLIVAAEANGACDYIGYCLGDGRPVLHSRLGVFTDWCLAETLMKMDEKIVDPKIRRNATQYVCSHPETFCLRLIPVPPELDRDDLHFTDDDDWERIQEIFEVLGPDDIDSQRIASLLA
jgi:spore coat polysaccharide biosynthesis protein SpsF (cytidylyltransferase family)